MPPVPARRAERRAFHGAAGGQRDKWVQASDRSRFLPVPPIVPTKQNRDAFGAGAFLARISLRTRADGAAETHFWMMPEYYLILVTRVKLFLQSYY